MRILLFITFFLMLNHCGFNFNEELMPNQDSTTYTSQTFNINIEGKNPVTKDSGYHASGLIVGTFLKASEMGIIFDTKEVQVNKGYFPETRYVGLLTNMSIDDNDENMFNQLRQLDDQQIYVFKYKRPYDLNWEIENTHLHIIDVTPLNEKFSMNHQGVIKASSLEKKGYYEKKGEQQGKVVEVKRWGFRWDIDCSFNLHIGGLKSTAAAMPWFNVYTEEGCQFVEEALKAGIDVRVRYSTDYIEFWDDYNKIAEEISLVN